MPKCIGMKKINIRAIFLRFSLGVFLGMFLFVSGGVEAEDAVKCSSFTAEQQKECETQYDCRWNESWVDQDGGHHDAECVVGAEVCRSVNSREMLSSVEKAEMCVAKECWWKADSDDSEKGVCRPVVGRCDGRTWMGCSLDSDCRWLDGACMLRSAKQDEKAVAAIEGICKENVKDSGRNDFWIQEIPNPCVRPVTNEEILSFCGQNAEDLTPYGKRKCKNGIAYALKGNQQECLDNSEMTYQRSLKDSAAREQRRATDEACRANVVDVYSGPVFSGGGLRSGAILAHENLTKSISHETNLKSLVLGWTKFVLELVAILAVLAVVWAGILYITDMGDGGNQEKAKKILIWVAIGILVILGSYAIVSALMTADIGSSRAAIITSFDV